MNSTAWVGACAFSSFRHAYCGQGSTRLRIHWVSNNPYGRDKDAGPESLPHLTCVSMAVGCSGNSFVKSPIPWYLEIDVISICSQSGPNPYPSPRPSPRYLRVRHRLLRGVRGKCLHLRSFLGQLRVGTYHRLRREEAGYYCRAPFDRNILSGLRVLDNLHMGGVVEVRHGFR